LLVIIEPWLDWVAVSFRNLKEILYVRIPLADCDVIHGISDSVRGFRDSSAIDSLLSVTKVKIEPIQYLKFIETLWKNRKSSGSPSSKKNSASKKVGSKTISLVKRDVTSSPNLSQRVEVVDNFIFADELSLPTPSTLNLVSPGISGDNGPITATPNPGSLDSRSIY
jgi:hypothetical protein